MWILVSLVMGSILLGALTTAFLTTVSAPDGKIYGKKVNILIVVKCKYIKIKLFQRFVFVVIIRPQVLIFRQPVFMSDAE